jgi:tRNA-Thr(GGU) m(6)t(6)A37 methyltransferase TsaA
MVKYKPIGIFHSYYTPFTGAPRQGVLSPKSNGSIEIYDEYLNGLSYLENFEYIIVLYHFHIVKSWSPIVIPPGSITEHEFGVFATRSPKRPNPIGFSIVKLDSIQSGILYVSGIDAFDNSPIIDIKPYLPSIDCIKSVQNSDAETKLGHHDELFINDSMYYR